MQLDEEYKLNVKQKFLSQMLFNAYEYPETNIYYYEEKSIAKPEHTWIQEAIESDLINVTEIEYCYFAEPRTYNYDEKPMFYHVNQETYNIKKSIQPDSTTVEMYETWPQFTRYTLEITKRAERKLERLAAAKNIEEILGRQEVKLEDAVTIEIPIGIGKVDVVKLWRWFNS